MTITRARIIPIGVGVVAALLLTWLILWLVRPTPIPATPESAAARFAESYAAGDTPAACGVSSGMALTKMTRAGWCEDRQDWSATATEVDRCQLPGERWVFIYRTTSLVDASTYFTLRVGGLNDTWLVTNVGRGGSGQDGDPNLCRVGG